MTVERTIRFAGWNARTQGPSWAEVSDPAALAARLTGPATQKSETGVRGAPPKLDTTNPARGKWAVLVREDDAEAVREALRPLLEWRIAQGIAWTWPTNLRREPAILPLRPPRAPDPAKWVERVHEAALGRAPRYLLLVGGPDRFPFEAQRALDESFFTGRLDVGDTPTGPLSFAACRIFAEKIVRYERGEMPVEPRPLFYSFATDDATRLAHEGLSLPLEEHVTRTLELSLPESSRLHGDDATTPRLVERLATERPALVVTVSHGLEMPEDPALWGALSDSTFVGGTGGLAFSASAVRPGPFAPGAVFLAFACFSAGVPRQSAHRLLTGEGDGDLPFAPCTAPLARALLAHPDGPVAFVGHVDRTTSGSFESNGSNGPEAFCDFASWTLADTGTLGQAMSTFQDRARSAARRLADLLSPAMRRARSPDALVDAWVRYHDATGYVLLGDPALSVGKARLAQPGAAVFPVHTGGA